MKPTRLKLKIITPLFLGGAITNVPELRGAPFRGELRYWLRAYLAYRFSGMGNLATLQRVEAQFMGSTDLGSPITLRTWTESDLEKNDFSLLPHKPGAVMAIGFSPGQAITLEVVPRYFEAGIPDEIRMALWLWLHLGGVGKRARRGYGSLQQLDDKPVDGRGITEMYQKILQNVGLTIQLDFTSGSEFPASLAPNASNYPGFFPSSCFTIICRQAFSSYQELFDQFWRLHLRASGLAAEYAYGYVLDRRVADHPSPDSANNKDLPVVLAHKRDGSPIYSRRRASPFHLHVAETTQGYDGSPGYHVIYTAFHDTPAASRESWRKVTELGESLWREYQGTIFYG